MKNNRHKLLVFATSLEARGVVGQLLPEGDLVQGRLYSINSNTDLIITGIGILNTAMALGVLLPNRYGLVLNLGIAGVYPQSADRFTLSVGDVVWVKEERQADLGTEDGHEFIPFESETFISSFNVEEWMNPDQIKDFDSLYKAKGLTVQCCTGSIETAKRRQQWGNVESMEGAAVAAWAFKHSIEWLELRALSNIAAQRDKSQWRIEQALKNLRNLVQSLFA